MIARINSQSGRRDTGAFREGQAPLRILEVGAGIGTMIERLLERAACPG